MTNPEILIGGRPFDKVTGAPVEDLSQDTIAALTGGLAPVGASTTKNDYYTVNTAFTDGSTSIAVGDTVINTPVSDASGVVTSDTWAVIKNGVTTPLSSAPNNANIDFVPPTPLTASQLKSLLPLNVNIAGGFYDKQFVVTQYIATVNGTGYSTGDLLDRNAIFDVTTNPPTLQTTVWLNASTDQVLASTPAAGNYAPTSAQVLNVHIPDGFDENQGSTTDAAVLGDVDGTVSAKLRGLSKVLSSVWDSTNNVLNVTASLSKNVTTTGSITGTDNVSADCDGFASLLFTVSGTWSGNIDIEGYDGTNWLFVNTITSSSAGAVSVATFKQARLIGNTVTGTADVILNISPIVSEVVIDGGVLLSDGTNKATINPASTAAAATDTALVVAISPNSNNIQIADGNDVALGAQADAAVLGDTSGSVSAKLRGLSKILNSVWSSAKNLLNVGITDGTNSVAIKGANALISATDPYLAVGFSPNSNKVAVSGVVTTVSPSVTAQYSANLALTGSPQTLNSFGITQWGYITAGKMPLTINTGSGNNFVLAAGASFPVGLGNFNQVIVTGTSGDVINYTGI